MKISSSLKDEYHFMEITIVFFLLLIITVSCHQPVDQAYTEWTMYSGDPTGSKYSSLDQINKNNVKDLQIAWTFHTGDMRKSPPTTIQCNPIIIGDIMYISSPALKVFALNAETGEELWHFDPFEGQGSFGENRGLTFFDDHQGGRLFFVAGSWLYAIHAGTGALIDDFGTGGKIDLYEGLGREVHHLWLTAPTPGVIYEDLLILGSRVGEGPGPVAPGHIRAFDVHSGELKWIFHTIPFPDEFGYETWPEEAWKTTGGANSWGGFTLDKERGIVFCGTGSAAYDHWGGNREGANLFANCILALDAATGERIWHFQVVHHDIWDYDLASPPNLVSIIRDGVRIDAVAQPTKMGHLFVLDRETGKPLYPVKEIPIPDSGIPGERNWPTQPFPPEELRYARQSFTMDDVTDVTPQSRKVIMEKLEGMQLGDIFLPPSQEGTIMLPQFNGGTNWGGAAYDPVNHFIYVNCSNEPEWISMIPASPVESLTRFELGRRLYGTICSACHGFGNPRNPGSPSLEKLRGIRESKTKKYVDSVLVHGKGQMPRFSSLNELERKSLISWLWDEGKEVKIPRDSIKLSFSNDIPFVATGHNALRDHLGLPANTPPWGTLTAIDLNRGAIQWQVPLGTYPELEQKGFDPTGTFNMGGSVITGGGLVFIGATLDERFRAFDKDTGEVLWEFQLESGAYATPATYSINDRQYIVIAAGGGGKPETPPGDIYYCFSLPD